MGLITGIDKDNFATMPVRYDLMGLRRKTLLAIGTTFILMVLIIYSITSAIMLGGYAKLERQNILQNVDQAMKMIDDELSQLKSVVGDWARWDSPLDSKL